jgi:hypothetical protein
MTVGWRTSSPIRATLLVPYPSDPMKMWSISTRLNKPENDDAELLTPITFRQQEG